LNLQSGIDDDAASLIVPSWRVLSMNDSLNISQSRGARGEERPKSVTCFRDHPNEDDLLPRVRARAKENDGLERRGRLKPIPFDVKAVRQTLAEKIRAALGMRRMTQAQLAKALKITPANITRILKSPEKSKVETLERIAAALRVDIADFF
jgi:DNA-binding Xre family transcriptional regulator